MRLSYFKAAGLIFISAFFVSLNQISAQQMVEGIHYATGKPVQIKIESGIITEIKSIQKLKDEYSKIYIAPGFFDNQVNGFAGISFAFGESDLTEKGIE
ncbi:MAG TPA: hypothetical protein P5210_04325, partial [Draconibacterium sp.]|nr:hypothetical protein [Draconibacterium sp.]